MASTGDIKFATPSSWSCYCCLPASFQGWRSLDQIFMPSFAFYGKDICLINNNNDNTEGGQQTKTHQASWVCGLTLRRWLSIGCWPVFTSHPLHKTDLCSSFLATGWYIWTIIHSSYYIPSVDLHLFCILRGFIAYAFVFCTVSSVCDVFSPILWSQGVKLSCPSLG